jgi:hypothetical protein
MALRRGQKAAEEEADAEGEGGGPGPELPKPVRQDGFRVPGMAFSFSTPLERRARRAGGQLAGSGSMEEEEEEEAGSEEEEEGDEPPLLPPSVVLGAGPRALLAAAARAPLPLVPLVRLRPGEAIIPYELPNIAALAGQQRPPRGGRDAADAAMDT